MNQKPLDLVVLAGGAATRMGPVCKDIPKSLLPVDGLPFLSMPLATLEASGFDGRVVLCARTGFRAAFENLKNDIEIVEEKEPLGTGGAILNALAKTRLSDPFLVINGDVLFRMDASAVAEAARKQGAALAAIHVPDAQRFGRLEMAKGCVEAFLEKSGNQGAGVINAGLYAFTHAALRGFSCKPCSFEREIAPVLASRGQLAAVVAKGPFIDIGTLQAYAALEDFIAANGFAKPAMRRREEAA